MNVTRLIESSNFEYWECEECGESWVMISGTPQDNNYNYCCNCGRKIIEYVPFDDDLGSFYKDLPEDYIIFDNL